jgi:hypothetical protein
VKHCRQPSDFGGITFGENGQLGFFHRMPRRGFSAFDLAQRLDDGVLADAAEIVRGCRHEPCGHVEVDGLGKTIGVVYLVAAWISYLRPVVESALLKRQFVARGVLSQLEGV